MGQKSHKNELLPNAWTVSGVIYVTLSLYWSVSIWLK